MSEINKEDIIMKDEINAFNQSQVVLSMIKKELKFNLDPNIQTNIANYFVQNNPFSKKLIDQEQAIQQLINDVVNLSKSYNNLVQHCKDKFILVDGTFNDYALTIDEKIKLVNNDIMVICNYINEEKKEQESLKEYVNKIGERIEKHQENLNKVNEFIKENEITKQKIEAIDKVLKENDIKIEIKEVENKEIKNKEIKKYATNLDGKELRLKLYNKNSTIYFKDITKDCLEKENEYAEKFKVILKKDEDTEKGITYAVSKLGKDWNFDRHMKNIMRRLNNSINIRKVNIKNFEYVFKMVWTKDQIQFIKTPATPKFINNNKFFVKIGSNMVYVNRKRRFYRSNFKAFGLFRKDKNNNYNFKNSQNLSSKNDKKNNRNFNNENSNNKNINNRKNGNNRNNNNNRRFNNNIRFNNSRRFNQNRFNNRNKNIIQKVIRILPKLINNR